MNIQYLIAHGQNGGDVSDEFVTYLSDRVVDHYYNSSSKFWMWKMFQIGFAYGKHADRNRRKGVEGKCKAYI